MVIKDHKAPRYVVFSCRLLPRLSLPHNITSSTAFANTLTPRPSFSVKDQVSHPYRTKDKNHSSVYLKYIFWG